MLRSHHLGELTQKLLGNRVTLCGWIERIRPVGGINFIVMRDRYATLQLSLDTGLLQADKLGREDCIQVEGILELRPDKDRKDARNGEFELHVDKIVILNKSEIPPFVIDDKDETSEDTRLKYRYLDLRRKAMKDNMVFVHEVSRSVRVYLDSQNFLEVETPLMMKSTPEGSRDFLIPSRIYPGEFFALPQSPQLYKQMIQVAGLDRYYQFAKCFRDEDARKDRQMVHTQIDLEMSFVNQEDIFGVVEGFLGLVFERNLGKKLHSPFERICYDECIRRFGVDKPDLRFGMEFVDLADLLSASAFEPFAHTAQTGGRIAGFVVPGGSKFSRKQLDAFSDFVKDWKAKCIYYAKVEEKGFSAGMSKHIPESSVEALYQRIHAKPGDLLVVMADKKSVVNPGLGNLRNHVASKMDEILEQKDKPYINPDQFRFLWVTDFPLFEYNEDEKRWEAMHHMFTRPKDEHVKYFDTGELEKIYGVLYDLVLNGVELGSGSLRIHNPELQKRVFELVGLTEKQIENRFGFFLQSLRFGAPPHGGIALGLARLTMSLLQLSNMRDVIAFPNASAQRYLLDDSPTPVDEQQLRELHLRLNPKE